MYISLCLSLMFFLFPHPPSSSVDEDESILVPRHLLVLLNPASGPGKTVSDFKQHIQPLFDLAEINYNLIVTGTCSCMLLVFSVLCACSCTCMWSLSGYTGMITLTSFMYGELVL